MGSIHRIGTGETQIIQSRAGPRPRTQGPITYSSYSSTAFQPPGANARMTVSSNTQAYFSIVVDIVSKLSTSAKPKLRYPCSS